MRRREIDGTPPDIACYKGRQRIADDEHRHNGSPLCEERPCTQGPELKLLPSASDVHASWTRVEAPKSQQQIQQEPQHSASGQRKGSVAGYCSHGDA